MNITTKVGLFLTGRLKLAHEFRDLNILNNVIADLIEKGAITCGDEPNMEILRNPDYSPENILEKQVLIHGFKHRTNTTFKIFHLNLYGFAKYIREHFSKVNPKYMDAETKPYQHIENSTNDNMARILPYVIFGNIEGDSKIMVNDNWKSAITRHNKVFSKRSRKTSEMGVSGSFLGSGGTSGSVGNSGMGVFDIFDIFDIFK